MKYNLVFWKNLKYLSSIWLKYKLPYILVKKLWILNFINYVYLKLIKRQKHDSPFVPFF